MDEFEFIKSIQQKNYVQPTLIKGIGDDAAVFRQSYKDTVTAVDTFVENVHFSRQTMEPYHIGYRVLAANLSDMAAMGCDPAYYLISIVIPKGWSELELKDIYRGMKDLATEHHVDLIGGDTVSGQELVISVTVLGFVDKNKARYRSSALDKDIVFVTGTLGDSAAGLYQLTSNNEVHHQNDFLINRHRMPSPRVNFANALSDLNRVSLNDISDGIANEAAEIAEASNVTLNLDYKKLPYSKELDTFPQHMHKKWKLFGGEDYELIGTVSEKDWQLVIHAAKKTNTQVTRIGYVTQINKKIGKVLLHEGSNCYQLDKAGYTHLK